MFTWDGSARNCIGNIVADAACRHQLALAEKVLLQHVAPQGSRETFSTACCEPCEQNLLWRRLPKSSGCWLLFAWQAVIATELQFAYRDEQMAARKLIAAKALRFKPIPKDIVGWKVQYHDQLQTCRTCTLDIVVGHYPATLRGALLKWGVQNGSSDPMIQEQLVDVQHFIMRSIGKKNQKASCRTIARMQKSGLYAMKTYFD